MLIKTHDALFDLNLRSAWKVHISIMERWTILVCWWTIGRIKLNTFQERLLHIIVRVAHTKWSQDAGTLWEILSRRCPHQLKRFTKSWFSRFMVSRKYNCWISMQYVLAITWDNMLFAMMTVGEIYIWKLCRWVSWYHSLLIIISQASFMRTNLTQAIYFRTK